MDFFLTPTYASQAVQLLGLTIAIVYLLTRKKKSVESWLIMLILATWGTHNAILFLYETTHTHLLISGTGFITAPVLTGMYWATVLVFLLFLGALIYRLGNNYTLVESRLFTGVIIVILIAHWSIYLSNLNDSSFLVSVVRFETNVILVGFGWLILVALRKLRYFHSIGAEKRDNRMVQMCLLTTITALIYVFTTSFIVVLVVLSAEVRGILPALCAISIVSLPVIGYLLYGREQHSVSVKLVGFLMITYVAIFAIILPILRPEVDLRRAFQNPDSLPSLVFSPDSSGGYTASRLEPEWTDPAGASFVIGDDNEIPFKTPFPFTFYGVAYDSIWVGANGSVSFGVEIDADRVYSQGESFFDPVPSAMIMYSDFLMAGADARLIVDESPDHLVLTWFKISNYDQHESTYTMQTVLFANGRIQFNYKDISSIPLIVYTGISPGGPANPMTFPDQFFGAPGQALFEFQDTRDDYRAFVHPLILPATLVGTIGLFIVLLLGLLFYRAGILLPLERVLEGLRAVETGDLDKKVIITERNELGSLADYFNQMTGSLRDYRDKMEDLVSKRTADLDRTIQDLKATQAQLVEQEKLASLGALTAGIAHEIQNPLNFVNNFAEVGGELYGELREAIDSGDTSAVDSILTELELNSEQITKHGKRADSIVRSMMQHAKGGVSEMETIHLNDFLEEYANLAWHGMRARDHGFQAEIIRDLDPAVTDITAMPQELGRVILNLLNNAFDAIRETENPVITITTRAIGKEVEITLSDNGPGIPEEIRDKV
ncbi:MAG: HAMP domain-containing sensor histidine kinase, partial [Bacteroidetes bacterium]